MPSKVRPFFKEIKYACPLEAFGAYADDEGSLLLDSADNAVQHESTNRYSYIAIDPFETISIKNGCVVGEEKVGTAEAINPFAALKKSLSLFQLSTHPELPPFQGGIAGYFSYDLLQYVESVPLAQDDMEFPDLAVGLYDVVISFDHVLKRAWVVSSGFPEETLEKRRMRAQARIDEVMLRVSMARTLPDLPEFSIPEASIQSGFTPKEYVSAVERCKQYIVDGDIFEVNLSQRFKTHLPEGVTPFDLYRVLREVNPTPFAAYYNVGDIVIASASPERFLWVKENKVEARPIKGTAPRGDTETEDQLIGQALLASEKDRAENVMIVDLMRNDLSKVCKPGTVKVEKLCGLETFPNVHHLVSVVTAELEEASGPVELLEASFPGGSITGAPKVRAMEIISELERNARGPYCGSIGLIGFDGGMDLSIVIRTFCLSGSTVTFQVGGAIVLDSDPWGEYQETLTKASGLMKVLTKGGVCDTVT